MIKLVLSDLDSTLIWQGDHTITSFALEAIHTLQAAGVVFAACTGRIYRDLINMLGRDSSACSTAVTSNGQLVYFEGELIEKTALPHQALVDVRVDLASVPDAYLVVEYEGQKTGIGVDEEYLRVHPDNFWHVNRALPEVPSQPCYKANVRVVGTYERCKEVAASLAGAHSELDFMCPMPNTPHIDVTPHGFGKDYGSDVLMKRLGLHSDEVCCFGDAENDLSVLRHYPNSVAVANAVESVRQTARWHIGVADKDSVAYALLDIAHATQAGHMPDFMS